MIAISNDIDGTDIQNFRELHRFLNTEKDTRMGPGVGLDIADSFWMYNLADETTNGETQYAGDDTMSYWRGHCSEATQNAEEIRQYINCGWIDTLHSYGDFSIEGGFTRTHAEEAIAELNTVGCQVQVWTNHGDIKNSQNFYGTINNNFTGDNPDSDAYHTDLTLNNGIEFVWNKTGSQLGYESIIKPVSLWDGQQVWGFQRFTHNTGPKSFLRNQLGKVASRVETITGISSRIFTVLKSNLWHPERLHEQLSEKNLQQLVDNGQYAIIGQHLGCREKLLPVSARKALRRLRERQDEKDILVTRTSRLLEYNRVWKFLEYSVHGDVIDISHVADPIFDDFVPEIEQLRGITFYTEGPSTTSITLRGDPIPEDELKKNPPDGEMSSIGVRWFEPDRTDYTP